MTPGVGVKETNGNAPKMSTDTEDEKLHWFAVYLQVDSSDDDLIYDQGQI